MTPKISIILPVFNGEKYLQKCIDSVIRQKLSDFEFLIGDDCSKDASSQIIRNFADERMRYFGRDTNLGLFKNLNMLIKSAQSPIIRILCQDDMLEPECLEEETSFFLKYPNIGMSFCKSYRIDQKDEVTGKCTLGDLPDIVKTELSIQCFLYHGCMPGSLSTVCVRKECFDKIGLFNEEYRAAADYEMWVRICKRKDLGVIHKRLVRLRHHPEQLSRTKASTVLFIRENRQVRAKLLPLLPEEVRCSAGHYVRLRHNVLDTHSAVMSLLHGRQRDFMDIINIMGAGDFSIGLLWWALTFNNRLYCPKPLFK